MRQARAVVNRREAGVQSPPCPLRSLVGRRMLFYTLKRYRVGMSQNDDALAIALIEERLRRQDCACETVCMNLCRQQAKPSGIAHSILSGAQGVQEPRHSMKMNTAIGQRRACEADKDALLVAQDTIGVDTKIQIVQDWPLGRPGHAKRWNDRPIIISAGSRKDDINRLLPQTLPARPQTQVDTGLFIRIPIYFNSEGDFALKSLFATRSLDPDNPHSPVSSLQNEGCEASASTSQVFSTSRCG